MQKEKRHNLSVIIFLLGLMVFGVLLYFYVQHITDTSLPERPKEIVEYDVPSQGLPVKNPGQVLKEDTGILGVTVYDQENKVAGTLYDAYLEPETGNIEWLSVRIDEIYSGAEERLVLLPYANINNIQNGAIMLDMSLTDLTTLPAQKSDEQDLKAVISVRKLPGTEVRDLSGKKLGMVQQVIFSGRTVETILFKTSQALDYAVQKNFSLPFEGTVFKIMPNETDGDTTVILTERQAGAVEAYIKAN